jgi:endonuclease-3
LVTVARPAFVSGAGKLTGGGCCGQPVAAARHPERTETPGHPRVIARRPEADEAIPSTLGDCRGVARHECAGSSPLGGGVTRHSTTPLLQHSRRARVRSRVRAASSPVMANAVSGAARPLKRRARRERIGFIIQALAEQHPDAALELRFSTPLELLVATILSAQCTDRKVNEVTRSLFRAYPTARAYAEAREGELERQIHATGFFRTKAGSLRRSARILVEHYGGEVPSSMRELTKLPGIGRKTANVILANAFGVSSGIAVDTHVHRLARRLKLTRQQDPDRTERDLTRLIPKNQWIVFANRMILHGRYVCTARKPRCGDCLLEPACPASTLA